MKTSPDFTKQEEITIYVVCGVNLAIYGFVLLLALHNLIRYIYKLRITKLLILFLYFFCIAREISTPILLILFIVNPNSMNSNQSATIFFLIISYIFEIGLVFTVTLTNYADICMACTPIEVYLPR